MTRLILTALVAGAFATACGAPGPVASPGVPAEGQVALTQLCDAGGDASLSGVAAQLENVDAGTDTSQLQIALGNVASNIGQLDLSGDQSTARDAALSAVQQVQGALSNPTTLPEVAASAAGALRQLQGAVC